MDANVLLAAAGGLLLVYALGRLLAGPARAAGRVVGQAVLGGVGLLAINRLGALLAGAGLVLHLPLNPFTALLAGLLGLPGVLLVAALQRIL